MNTETNPRYSEIIVGQFGENQLLRGWHERQRDGRFHIPYRSSSEDGVLVLRRLREAQNINFLISGPAQLHGGTMRGYAIIGRQKYELPLTIDNWVLRTYPIQGDDDTIKIRLFLKTPIVPDQVLHNGDARRLGWYLSAVWQD